MINQLTSEILFRCPCCQKLFCTEKSDIRGDADSVKTEFQCSSCLEDFFVFTERNEMGLLKTEPRKKFDFAACSKCGFLKDPKHDECPSCGVIETRYQDLVKLENPRLFELNKKWSFVVTNLTDDRSHQDFLNLAQNMSALNFAAQKYQDLKKVLGEDSLVEKYLSQIELRLAAVIEQQMNLQREKNSFSKSNNTSGKFFGFRFSLKSFFLLIAFTGGIFVLANVFRPLFPSLNGLFIAIVVLSIGLWSLSKNQGKTY